MNEDDWMDINTYFAAERARTGPDLSPENVARAVRFLEAWSPIGARSMGSAAAGDLELLCAFARKQLSL